LTIVYEQAGGDQVTARVPRVPGAISFGASRDEARKNVFDALAKMLSVEPAGASPRVTTERLHMTFWVERRLTREAGLER